MSVQELAISQPYGARRLAASSGDPPLSKPHRRLSQRIGDAFGGRNHATVLHACKRVSERIHTDPEAASEVDHLVGSLTTSGTDRDC